MIARPAPRGRSGRWLAPLLVALGAVSCSPSTSPNGQQAIAAERTDHDEELTASDPVDLGAESEAARSAASTPAPGRLAFRAPADDEGPDFTVTLGTGGSPLNDDSIGPSTTTAAPATTAGSGAAPATTVRSGGGVDTSIYQGVLGRLGRDDVVVSPLATPPAAVAGVLPLTGLPGDVPNRPAIVVKIDNGRPARPQTGLNAADIVIEEEVEGGVTRFAAVFHSSSSIVGPVRSARTTDIGIINGFGSPLLLYSGANAVTDSLIRAQPTVQNRSAATSSGYWRSSSRRAPSNLYSDTAPHWATAAGGPPPAQFHYRDPDEPAGGVEDSTFTVAYRASNAGWSWVGTHWIRTQGGAAHMTAGAGQISATNVVVIEADEVATGMVDSSGATVPEFVFVGRGKATVFTGGKRIEGLWNRPTLASAATLTGGDGSVIELAPGRTWIELVRSGAGMLR
jgi:hypothetical protein